jgi:hypothetical protein
MSDPLELCWFCKKEPASVDSSITTPLYKKIDNRAETKEVVVPRCSSCERVHKELGAGKYIMSDWGALLVLILSIAPTIIYGYRPGAKLGWGILIFILSLIIAVILYALISILLKLTKSSTSMEARAYDYPACKALLKEGWSFKYPKLVEQRAPKVDVKTLESKKDIDGLIAALETRDMNIRRKAINALGRIGNEKAIMPLINALHTEVAFAVKIDAVKALGNLGDERAIQPLTRALESEYTTAGGFSDMADLARQAAKARQNIDNYKQAIKDALEKIRARIAKE